MPTNGRSTKQPGLHSKWPLGPGNTEISSVTRALHDNSFNGKGNDQSNNGVGSSNSSITKKSSSNNNTLQALPKINNYSFEGFTTTVSTARTGSRALSQKSFSYTPLPWPLREAEQTPWPSLWSAPGRAPTVVGIPGTETDTTTRTAYFGNGTAILSVPERQVPAPGFSFPLTGYEFELNHDGNSRELQRQKQWARVQLRSCNENRRFRRTQTTACIVAVNGSIVGPYSAQSLHCYGTDSETVGLRVTMTMHENGSSSDTDDVARNGRAAGTSVSSSRRGSSSTGSNSNSNSHSSSNNHGVAEGSVSGLDTDENGTFPTLRGAVLVLRYQVVLPLPSSSSVRAPTAGTASPVAAGRHSHEKSYVNSITHSEGQPPWPGIWSAWFAASNPSCSQLPLVSARPLQTMPGADEGAMAWRRQHTLAPGFSGLALRTGQGADGSEGQQKSGGGSRFSRSSSGSERHEVGGNGGRSGGTMGNGSRRHLLATTTIPLLGGVAGRPGYRPVPAPEAVSRLSAWGGQPDLGVFGNAWLMRLAVAAGHVKHVIEHDTVTRLQQQQKQQQQQQQDTEGPGGSSGGPGDTFPDIRRIVASVNQHMQVLVEQDSTLSLMLSNHATQKRIARQCPDLAAMWVLAQDHL